MNGSGVTQVLSGPLMPSGRERLWDSWLGGGSECLSEPWDGGYYPGGRSEGLGVCGGWQRKVSKETFTKHWDEQWCPSRRKEGLRKWAQWCKYAIRVWSWSAGCADAWAKNTDLQVVRSADATDMEWRCPRQESKKLHQECMQAKGPTGKLQMEHQWHGRGVSRAGEPGAQETHGFRLRKREGTDRHLEHMEATGEGSQSNGASVLS